MKDLKNLKGAKVISKMEQKVIKGGRPKGEVCSDDYPIVICYFPEHCELVNGTSICVL